MKRHFIVGVACAGVVSIFGVLNAQTPANTDWPQWRGPARNGISRETGLAKSWPAG